MQSKCFLPAEPFHWPRHFIYKNKSSGQILKELNTLFTSTNTLDFPTGRIYHLENPENLMRNLSE